MATVVCVATLVGRDSAAQQGGPVLPETTKQPYWQEGEPRLFAAARIEAGLYLKPQVAVGYGLPYWMNATVEAYGISTASFGAGYAGIRGSLPFFDLRVGGRYTYSYYRSFLPIKNHYEASDVSDPQGPLARYASLETELYGTVPVLGGYVFPIITAYAIINAPGDRYLFDESLRGILKPPHIIGFRLGYVKGFGKEDFIKVGALSELVWLSGREASIVRVGPAALVTLTDHLDAQGTLTLVLRESRLARPLERIVRRSRLGLPLGHRRSTPRVSLNASASAH